jgi:hypothetical protein
VRRRTAVARAAIRQQPDAATRGSRQQRLEESAGLRRAVVPDHRERVTRVRAATVVHAQRAAAILEPKILLRHHDDKLEHRAKVTFARSVGYYESPPPPMPVSLALRTSSSARRPSWERE